jgi:hypothetical protein
VRNNLGYNFIKKKEYWEEQIDKDENFLKEIEDEIEQEKQNEKSKQIFLENLNVENEMTIETNQSIVFDES